MSLDQIMQEQPEVINSMYRYKHTIFKDGSLSEKEKELVAVAVICVLKCEECLEVHAQRALQLGATKDEIREAVMVAMYLAGPQAAIWSKKIDQYISDHPKNDE
ncbi:MAG: Alkyl hydroperoxide reductase AhpD [Methanomassiliicoccales archaeon PtaU1.Bin124]|nr:MAG: Alkyl hydroperoxide reductase AhpD [Methanomassiliicoccales archaeon PtaU1.Bin124]